jgi:hypothetical protein
MVAPGRIGIRRGVSVRVMRLIQHRGRKWQRRIGRIVARAPFSLFLSSEPDESAPALSGENSRQKLPQK